MLVGALACAAGPGAVRKQIESSLLVSGWIDIDATGHVERFEVDQRDKVPDSVLSLLGDRIPQWAFEPVLVDDRPTKARTNMSVRVVVKRIDDDQYGISVRSADFSGDKASSEETVTSRSLRPPSYPVDAVRSNVQGTVYLVLKIGLDGAVQDAVVEQVNLRVAGSDSQMTRARALLSDSALAATKRWSFNVPAGDGDEASSFRSVRVPVDYMLGTGRKTGYGNRTPTSWAPGSKRRGSWKTSILASAPTP